MNIYDRAAKNKQKIGPSNAVFRSWIFELFGKGFNHRGTEDTEKAGAEEVEEVEH